LLLVLYVFLKSPVFRAFSLFVGASPGRSTSSGDLPRVRLGLLMRRRREN